MLRRRGFISRAGRRCVDGTRNAAVLENNMKDRRIIMLLIALNLMLLLAIMMTRKSYCCRYLLGCTLISCNKRGSSLIVEQDRRRFYVLHFSLLIPSLKSNCKSSSYLSLFACLSQLADFHSLPLPLPLPPTPTQQLGRREHTVSDGSYRDQTKRRKWSRW